MSFDAIGAFVTAEALGLDTGVAGILHRLGINEQQCCPLGFFFTCARTYPCNRCGASGQRRLRRPATACSANRRLSREAGL